jgi:hypothetical protein
LADVDAGKVSEMDKTQHDNEKLMDLVKDQADAMIGMKAEIERLNMLLGMKDHQRRAAEAESEVRKRVIENAPKQGIDEPIRLKPADVLGSPAREEKTQTLRIFHPDKTALENCMAERDFNAEQTALFVKLRNEAVDEMEQHKINYARLEHSFNEMEGRVESLHRQGVVLQWENEDLKSKNQALLKTIEDLTTKAEGLDKHNDALIKANQEISRLTDARGERIDRLEKQLSEAQFSQAPKNVNIKLGRISEEEIARIAERVTDIIVNEYLPVEGQRAPQNQPVEDYIHEVTDLNKLTIPKVLGYSGEIKPGMRFQFLDVLTFTVTDHPPYKVGGSMWWRIIRDLEQRMSSIGEDDIRRDCALVSQPKPLGFTVPEEIAAEPETVHAEEECPATIDGKHQPRGLGDSCRHCGKIVEGYR